MSRPLHSRCCHYSVRITQGDISTGLYAADPISRSRFLWGCSSDGRWADTSGTVRWSECGLCHSRIFATLFCDPDSYPEHSPARVSGRGVGESRQGVVGGQNATAQRLDECRGHLTNPPARKLLEPFGLSLNPISQTSSPVKPAPVIGQLRGQSDGDPLELSGGGSYVK